MGAGPAAPELELESAAGGAEVGAADAEDEAPDGDDGDASLAGGQRGRRRPTAKERRQAKKEREREAAGLGPLPPPGRPEESEGGARCIFATRADLDLGPELLLISLLPPINTSVLQPMQKIPSTIS